MAFGMRSDFILGNGRRLREVPATGRLQRGHTFEKQFQFIRNSACRARNNCKLENGELLRPQEFSELSTRRSPGNVAIVPFACGLKSCFKLATHLLFLIRNSNSDSTLTKVCANV